MVCKPLSLRRLRAPLVAAAMLSSAVTPLCAAVTTVFTCAGGGNSGPHDTVFDGFFVQSVNAGNLHSVTLAYRADQDGSYTVTLTARRGSFGGPLVGTTQMQNVSLSSTTDTLVTWSFGDAPITPGDNLYFTHTSSGSGNVQFSLSSDGCAGDEETVGTSSNLNGFSVGVTITQNTSPPPACPNPQTLCIDDHAGDKRFQITVSFTTANGAGNGVPIDLTKVNVDLGGLFWFFNSANPEMLIKVLDGCALNNHFWVFYSAGTNVGFRVTVRDTKTGHQLVYTNPLNTPAPPVQDTNAFLCP